MSLSGGILSCILLFEHSISFACQANVTSMIISYLTWCIPTGKSVLKSWDTTQTTTLRICGFGPMSSLA